MMGWHDREFEERGRSPVKHLNIHTVDLLELLCQNGVIVSVQDLCKGQDEIAPQGAGDISRLENGERTPQLVDTWLAWWVGESYDDLRGLRTLSDAGFV
jgi:hypothetical protein